MNKPPTFEVTCGDKMTTKAWERAGKPNWWVRIGYGQSYKFLTQNGGPGNQFLHTKVDLAPYNVVYGDVIYFGVGHGDEGVRGAILLPDPSVDDTKLTWVFEPEKELTVEGHRHLWKTTCQRYCVMRSVDRKAKLISYSALWRTRAAHGKPYWDSVQIDPAWLGGPVTSYPTLFKALSACQEFHRKLTRLEVTSNQEGLCQYAKEKGLLVKSFKEKEQLVYIGKSRVMVQRNGENVILNSKTTLGGMRRRGTSSVDAFGDEIGTKKAQFNKALTTEPMKMRELLERAGLDVRQTLYNHCRDLMNRGFVIQVNGGYCLKAQKR